jgi:hypothetical protein
MDQQGEGGMAGLFQPSLRMPLMVGLGLATFQQITGINTVIYHAPTIFKFAGISAAGPAILAGAGLTAVMWCFHVLAIFLLDRVGRRPLLLSGWQARSSAWASWVPRSSFHSWRASRAI